jgi:hypothetical protein
MIARHYPEPHKLICLTDNTKGLDPRIEAMPMPVTGFEGLPNPATARFKVKYFPSCYRRLWVFSEAAKTLGDRLFCLDIDVVITASLLPLVQRPESFVGWSDPKFGWNKIAGGAYMLTAGAHTDVWTDFDPAASPHLAATLGFNGSDQAWMSYKLFPSKGVWTLRDGMTKINWLGRRMHTLPPEIRFVFTTGHAPPWSAEVQRSHPWIKKHWGL